MSNVIKNEWMKDACDEVKSTIKITVCIFQNEPTGLGYTLEDDLELLKKPADCRFSPSLEIG